jgi:hypothetical protein
MLAWLIVGSTTLLGCLAYGAWPLLASRRLTPILQGTLGSLLIAAGSLIFAANCTTVAWADSDDGGAKSAAVDAPQAEHEDAGSSSGSQSAPLKAERDPHESASSSADPAAGHDHEPIEIESDRSTVIIPPGRPAWVEAPPMHVGEGVHTTSVSSGPFARMQDCWREFDQELVKNTNAYIEQHLGSKYAPQFIRYDAQEIRTQLVRPGNLYHEQITVSIGPMHQVHALLEFDKPFRDRLDVRWAEVCKYSRLTQAGLGIAAVLAFLGTIFGYFRVDNATRGYYTGRLQFLTAAAILTIVGVGVMLSRFVLWM